MSSSTELRARERLALIALTGVQMSQILDFMVVMPLGPQFMRLFGITPAEFALLVSAYMLAASAAGVLTALFIDRFDRRQALIVLYACFMLTTIVVATAQSYAWLLAARATAGAFGGVLGACVYAIVGDVIPEHRRGAALGTVMSASSIASIAGVPLSLMLAAQWTWRAPFLFLTVLCAAILAVAVAAVPRVHAHVESARSRHPFAQVKAVFAGANHLRALLFAGTLTFSGFVVIPFISPYMVANVGVKESELAILYFCGGLVTLVVVRWIGRMTDLHGKRRVFAAGAVMSMAAILILTHLPPAPLWVGILVSAFFMPTLTGRFVPAMAIVTAAVTPRLRGSFMSFNSAVQQLAAGLASLLAGLLVGRTEAGALTGYGRAGWIAAAGAALCVALSRRVRSAETEGRLHAAMPPT